MADEREWYIPDEKGEEPLGPFNTEQILTKLSNGDLRIDSFVWGRHFSDSQWKRIFEVKEFQAAFERYPVMRAPKRHSRGLAEAKKIKPRKEFKRKNNEFGSKNMYRRYPRVPFGAEAIIHNDKHYYKGACGDISERGIFVNVDDLEKFEKGEEVVVTLRNTPNFGTFSVRGVIIRLASRAEKQGYGIIFLRLNPATRRQIAKYILNKLEFGDEATLAGVAS